MEEFCRVSSKSSLGLILFLLAFSILFTAKTFAVPAFEQSTFEVTQPDGTTLTLRPIGDESNGRYVTLDDFTVVKNDNGWYCYAEQNESGELVASEIVVSNARNKSVDEAELEVRFPKRLAAADQKPRPSLGGLEILDLNNSGGERILSLADVLVIMVKFPDEDTVYSTDDFDDLMNRDNFVGHGSVNNYYQEVSYGQFGVNGVVVGWYTAANNRAYYGYNGGGNWVAAAQLAREAVLAADAAGVDFSAYDNDDDGEVDGLFVVHAGPGAESGNDGYPWSHLWCLTCAGLPVVNADGKVINTYTMEPERLWSGITTIGVFCHEYGHALGLPDLYDTDGSSSGIGSWCNMAGGTWNGAGAVPAHMSAWCKARLNWVTPTNVNPDLWSETILNVEQNQSIYRLWSDAALGNEYYLVEYRRKTGFDSLLPGCGAAIWHIDDSRTSNSNDMHRWVDLEEADKLEDNSPGDLWLDRTFDSLSIPKANSYYGGNTKVKVKIISTGCEPNGLSAELYVGLPPSCCRGSRGNIDADEIDEITITDLTYLVDFLFAGGAAPYCSMEANTDGDVGEQINITDLTYLVEYLFNGGPMPMDCPYPY